MFSRAMRIVCLMVLLVVIAASDPRAFASELGVPALPTTLPPTTLPPTTLPPLIPSTTLPAVTLPRVTAPPTPSVTVPPGTDANVPPPIPQVNEQNGDGTYAAVDAVYAAAVSPVLDLCEVARKYLEATLSECDSAAPPGASAREVRTTRASSAVPVFPQTERGPDETDREDAPRQDPVPPPEEEAEDEAPPDLLQRLLDLIDELVNNDEAEVAGIQVLANTGLAVLRLAAIAVALFLAGLGILHGPDKSGGD